MLRYRLLGGVATALALAVLGAATPSLAAATAAGPVLSTPPTDLPHLLDTPTPITTPPDTAPPVQVRQLVQCGGTMYAVGQFTQIKRNSTVYTRDNIFSFQATSPFTVSSWAPAVNGVVNSIAFSGGSCADAYIGGKFSEIGSTKVKDIAKISTTTGAVVTAFAHSAEAQVETLISYKTHIIAGGYYTSINGSSADPYMTSLDSTTGQDDGFVSLNISGNYDYPGVFSNGIRVFNQAVSHSGTLDLVMGDFTSVGGLGRQQIFMLNLAGTNAAGQPAATVTGWTSPQWDGSAGEATPQDPTTGYPYECATNEPFYIQAAAWSPDDSTIYIGDTGYHPDGWPIGATPRNGLCDAAAAFPATQQPVTDLWINYTGCDSLFAAAADASAAYFGGHERWSENPEDCDAQGPGAIPAAGMEGLTPATGSLLLNSGGGALYTRSRGLGADDMLATSAGLWIASDNGDWTLVKQPDGQELPVWDGSQTCGGVQGLAGICFLPYASN
jgi:hypothetical protein